MNLAGSWASIAPIVSGIVKNVAKLNKSDIVWDQEFTITTTGAAGQSQLQEGIYVALGAVEESPEIVFRNNRLYARESGKLWPQSYLVFTIYRTPKVLNPVWSFLEERAEKLPEGFMDEFGTAMAGGWGGE